MMLFIYINNNFFLYIFIISNYSFKGIRLVTYNTQLMLTNSLVSCHFDYACSFYYSGLPKKFYMKPREHVSIDKFTKTKMFPMEYRVRYLKLTHMFKIFNGTAPSYLVDHILKTR